MLFFQDDICFFIVIFLKIKNKNIFTRRNCKKICKRNGKMQKVCYINMLYV